MMIRILQREQHFCSNIDDLENLSTNEDKQICLQYRIAREIKMINDVHLLHAKRRYSNDHIL